MDLAAKRYFSVGRMVTAVVRRWTEITMVLAGSSRGLCSIQACLFYEELAVDMIRLIVLHFDYL